MTGRKGRMVSTEEEGVKYQLRTNNDVSLDMLNIAEKQRFMDGEKVRRVRVIKTCPNLLYSTE